MKYLIIIFLIFISCSNENYASDDLILKINKFIPDELSVVSFSKSNIKNLYEVELSDGTFFYIDDQGDHIFLGDLFRIENNRLVNLSYVREKEKLLKLLNEIDRNSLITFDSPKKKYEVFVFTDVDCGFCRKFHKNIQSYLDLGIEINYLSFPREGLKSQTAKKLSTAWCSEDQKNTLTDLKLGKELPLKNCDLNPIEDHYNLAQEAGISGTPTFITENGFKIPGLVEADELIQYFR
tara:strand:+ start:1171 stop:1881 length:711 start_codon:yes stop_codon:yes gene_type:complete